MTLRDLGLGAAAKHLIQSALEDWVDADFSNVRIHSPKAAKARDAIDAKAFTCGNAIVFDSGEYEPKSLEGQYLLAHELAYVKQQPGGARSEGRRSSEREERSDDTRTGRSA